MQKIIFTVTNDLSYDQRMQRICRTLANAGYPVTLVGRKKADSIDLKNEVFAQKRLNCFFSKGKLFYLEYNLRLLFFLLTTNTDIIGAVDLDTLLPCFLVARLRSKKIVFDAHEHFTEVIEVVNRPFTRRVWLTLEELVLPRIQFAYTVSENLRKIFSEKYHVPFGLIRNLSELETYGESEKAEKYFIYAGAVNEGRGLKEFIQAMNCIPAKFYICGKGDIYEELLAQTKYLGLEDKVRFLGYVPPAQLKHYIRKAFAGCLLLENKGLSYYYSLANKFFDYMHAGIPQITIDFPEYRFINDQVHVAELIPLNVNAIIESANKLLNDPVHYQQMVLNTKKASLQYNWQKEAEKLLEFYQTVSEGGDQK